MVPLTTIRPRGPSHPTLTSPRGGTHTFRMEGARPWVAALLLISCLVSGVLSSSPIVFHVSEELPSGTLVGNVRTASNISQEVDDGDRDRLQFHILSGDGLRITSIFSINSRTGAIFTNAMMDREQLCDRNPLCQLEFDVTVKIDTNFLKLLTVRVIVDDVNDNAPTFPKGEITLTVSESAPVNSEIPISGALDRDAGINSTISYSLQVSSVFGLKEVKQLDGSSALRLVVQRSLDREAVASYTFLILAADGSGPSALTGTLTVSLSVSDVNDNVPVFSRDSFNLTVMETAPVGTVFGHVAASDGDVGRNGQLTYRFSLLTSSEVTDLFSLNSTSGEVSVAGVLQYESGRIFQCVVVVMDLGVPPQVSQASLRIHVQDAGNTPPKLDLILAEPVYGDQSAMLSEDVQVGTFVGTLKAEDLDEGPEGQVNCSSQDPHFFLQDLDTKRYGIVLSQTLDREEQQEMRVVLLCRDNGDPQLTSSTVFKIIVLDVNDNAPKFGQQVFRTSLTENGGGEQFVTRVVATDDDDSTNNVITYSLDPQSALLFSVDSVTGRITTLSVFDREVTPYVTLTVYARDSGNPALTGSASVSVRIADVNDNAPYVNRSDYYISENLPVGSDLNVLLGDQDQGENGTVVVTLAQGADLDTLPFDVLTNGSLRLRSALDREVRSTYVIPLVLTDLGTPPLSSTATLTIQVVDSNDHTPLFLFPTAGNDTVTVLVDSPVGSPVCQIKAEDSDMGLNGVVTFTIRGGNSGQWLAINNLTGDIFTIRPLTSLAGSTLELQVSASDQGTPPLVSHSVLQVILRTNHSGLMTGRADNGEEDRYVIIAGIMAGVTFLIAVVVIAVILHMRHSDSRRHAAMMAVRSKAGRVVVEEGGPVGVAWPKGTVLIDTSSKSGNYASSPSPVVVEGVRAGQGQGQGQRGNVELSAVCSGGSIGTQEESGGGGGGGGGGQGVNVGDVMALQQCHPSFAAGFPEGLQRLVSEDHNSDASGESTACDSGRGASDEEIVYPVPGKNSGKSFRSTPSPHPATTAALYRLSVVT
ncbi:protocadherin-9-like [Babylonia areolata]|uniref:protocadherin-9-like n=1 Tax=Babylonia areolata TaxID=304850 RepID=UPI003FCFB1B1